MSKPEDNKNENRLNDQIDPLDHLDALADAGPDEETSPDLEAVIAERDALQDKFMRALADAENTRKRAQKDRMDAERYGGTRLARDLLGIYDNMKRALEATQSDGETASPALIEGIELTMRELLSVFSKHGVTLISPQVGDRFDPSEHEAVFEAPLPETKAGDIIQVSSEGFMLHDRVLRPAQVGVSSNPG